MPVINTSALPSGNLKGRRPRSDDFGDPRALTARTWAATAQHPYDETCVVIAGDLTFHAGEQQLEAGPGDIVIVPPGTPRKFINHGPSRANLVCIHAHPTFVTEWLE